MRDAGELVGILRRQLAADWLLVRAQNVYAEMGAIAQLGPAARSPIRKEGNERRIKRNRRERPDDHRHRLRLRVTRRHYAYAGRILPQNLAIPLRIDRLCHGRSGRLLNWRGHGQLPGPFASAILKPTFNVTWKCFTCPSSTCPRLSITSNQSIPSSD